MDCATECKECGCLFIPGGKSVTDCCAGCYRDRLLAAETSGGNMETTHEISAVYFPSLGEVEATWEDIETGETVAVTFEVDEETGNKIAKIIPPCVYNLARETK